jgi:hypothetical protein
VETDKIRRRHFWIGKTQLPIFFLVPRFLKIEMAEIEKQVSQIQGDQIGRFFAHWAIV